MTASVSGDAEAIAAKLTLLALQEMGTPTDTLTSPSWYQFPPSLAPLSTEQAILELSHMKKPLMCVGFPIARGFVLCCWPLAPEYGRRIEMKRALAEQIRADLASKRENRVLVRTAREQILVSADQLEAWFTRYYLPYVNVRIGDTDNGSPTTEYAAVLTFFSAKGGIHGEQGE